MGVTVSSNGLLIVGSLEFGAEAVAAVGAAVVEAAGATANIYLAINAGNHYSADTAKLGGVTNSKPTVNYQGKDVPVYRRVKDFTVKPNEIKIDTKTELIKDTHGVSVDVNPDTVAKFGEAYKIDSLLEGLKIIQRGLRPEHFEIALSTPMTLEEFQQLLNLIEVSMV